MDLLNRAIKEAKKSKKKRFNHGVLVIKGGAIVAYGSNGQERHAEVVALNKLWVSKRKGCEIISIRVRVDGSLGMARPCVKCWGYLYDNGITKVTYSVPHIDRMITEKLTKDYRYPMVDEDIEDILNDL